MSVSRSGGGRSDSEEGWSGGGSGGGGGIDKKGGRYKCRHCGEIKRQHVCPALVDVPRASTGTQADMALTRGYGGVPVIPLELHGCHFLSARAKGGGGRGCWAATGMGGSGGSLGRGGSGDSFLSTGSSSMSSLPFSYASPLVHGGGGDGGREGQPGSLSMQIPVLPPLPVPQGVMLPNSTSTHYEPSQQLHPLPYSQQQQLPFQQQQQQPQQLLQHDSRHPRPGNVSMAMGSMLTMRQHDDGPFQM